jgi:hypothetical protein
MAIGQKKLMLFADALASLVRKAYPTVEQSLIDHFCNDHTDPEMRKHVVLYSQYTKKG